MPDHTRRLIEACKTLDVLYPDRRLWAWAHMLGVRGQFSSESRRYSTTLGALGQARADYRAAQEHATSAGRPRAGHRARRPVRLHLLRGLPPC